MQVAQVYVGVYIIMHTCFNTNVHTSDLLSFSLSSWILFLCSSCCFMWSAVTVASFDFSCCMHVVRCAIQRSKNVYGTQLIYYVYMHGHFEQQKVPWMTAQFTIAAPEARLLNTSHYNHTLQTYREGIGNVLKFIQAVTSLPRTSKSMLLQYSESAQPAEHIQKWCKLCRSIIYVAHLFHGYATMTTSGFLYGIVCTDMFWQEHWYFLLCSLWECQMEGGNGDVCYIKELKLMQ